MNKKRPSMVEALSEARSGSYPPIVVHLDGEDMKTTRLAIYKPDYSDEHGADPAACFLMYGSVVENLCKTLDAWRVKMKFLEDNRNYDEELPF